MSRLWPAQRPPSKWDDGAMARWTAERQGMALAAARDRPGTGSAAMSDKIDTNSSLASGYIEKGYEWGWHCYVKLPQSSIDEIPTQWSNYCFTKWGAKRWTRRNIKKANNGPIRYREEVTI